MKRSSRITSKKQAIQWKAGPSFRLPELCKCRLLHETGLRPWVELCKRRLLHETGLRPWAELCKRRLLHETCLRPQPFRLLERKGAEALLSSIYERGGAAHAASADLMDHRD